MADNKTRPDDEASKGRPHADLIRDARDQVEHIPPGEDTKNLRAEAGAQQAKRDERQPEKIGPYKILEMLGEGGMGTVYLAEQTEPLHRHVALKVIKRGMDTKSVVARFESERQALARMDHPGIAKVFDAGTTDDGRPFFVMERVHGERITDYCDRCRLTTEERLRLFMLVCEAVQHAHQKAVIHRDIKPSNILVAEQDGKAFPRIIDFGVAKATEQNVTEKTRFTEQGQLIGTPEYMSPEQAGANSLDIDTRSDIYSLGVVLYELLVGGLPFEPTALRRAAFGEIQRIICEQEPPKPSTRLSSLGQASSAVAERRRTTRAALQKRLHGDLDWITMMALEKDRARRYATPTEFAADLLRHLNNEPVHAGPPGAGYRLGKFLRRNRGGVTVFAVITLTLVVATAISANYAVREAAAKAEAQARADDLEQVTKFQQSTLGDIDVEEMGLLIFQRIRESIASKLQEQGTAEEQVQAEIDQFWSYQRLVNETDLARSTLDEIILARAAEAIEKDFADQPLVRAALQHTVADTYEQIGLYPRAMPLLKAVLQTRRTELGNDHPDTLNSIGTMGFLLQAMGELPEAKHYYREAMEGLRRLLGDDHPTTLAAIANMGGLLESMGELRDAKPYLREAMEGFRRVLGDDHPDTLMSINNMGGLFESMGEFAMAEPYYREALEGFRRTLGDDDRDTLNSISNMGVLLSTLGKLADAMPYCREALEGRQRVLGGDHPSTLTSINNMGLLLQSMGRLAEAESYDREALDGYRRVLGDDHPSTLRSINNIGFLLQAMGKLTEAEPYYREAIEGYRRTLGDRHMNTLVSIHNMGRLLRDLGRIEEAETLGAEAVRGAQATLGPSHPFRLAAMAQYGQTLTASGRFAEAETLLRESYGGFVAALGSTHERTIGCAEKLSTLYDAWHAAEPRSGYDAKAAEWRGKLNAEEASGMDKAP